MRSLERSGLTGVLLGTSQFNRNVITYDILFQAVMFSISVLAFMSSVNVTNFR